MTKEEAIKIIDCYDIGFYDLSGEKIPADKLVDAFDMAIEALLSAEAAEAAEETGEWIERFDGNDWFCYCSKCKSEWYEGDLYMGGNFFPNFCPNCGKRMLN